MSGEPIDITSHTHSQLSKDIQNNTKWICEDKEQKESKIAELEKRIVRLEKWHVVQEEFYGVVRERDMLTSLMRRMEDAVEGTRESHAYEQYPKEGFQSGYELNNEIDLRGK